MNRLPYFNTVLVIIFLTPVVIGAESGHSRADIAELTESACEMGRAYARQDFATLDRLNDEDYVQTDTRGVVVDRAEYPEYVRQRLRGATLSIECDNIQVKLYGDAAVVTGGWTYTSKKPESNLVTRTRWTSMWTRYATGWKRHVFQNTYVNPNANQCALEVSPKANR